MIKMSREANYSLYRGAGKLVTVCIGEQGANEDNSKLWRSLGLVTLEEQGACYTGGAGG